MRRWVSGFFVVTRKLVTWAQACAEKPDISCILCFHESPVRQFYQASFLLRSSPLLFLSSFRIIYNLILANRCRAYCVGIFADLEAVVDTLTQV